MLIHTYMNKRYGMGLGDFIRGSISCYQLCSIYRIPLVIDLRHHDIGKYLDLPHNFRLCQQHEIIDLQDIGKFTVACLKQQIVKRHKEIRMLRNKDCYIYTNVWPRFPLSLKEKQFMQSMLKPNAELERAIQNALPTRQEYEVIHVRSGDLLAFNTQIGETFERDVNALVDSISKVVNDVRRGTDRQLIVMSDSLQLKQILAASLGMLSLNTTPVHTALESSSLDTLIDFFVMTKAKHIHQFSVQHWGSGFSNGISWIYDVPLTAYKV